MQDMVGFGFDAPTVFGALAASADLTTFACALVLLPQEGWFGYVALNCVIYYYVVSMMRPFFWLAPD